MKFTGSFLRPHLLDNIMKINAIILFAQETGGAAFQIIESKFFSLFFLSTRIKC